MATGAKRPPPVSMVAVPADRFRKAGLERLPRPPAEFGRDLAGVDGIAGIMAGSVGHERDQAVVGRVGRVRIKLVEKGADAAHDVDVPTFAGDRKSTRLNSSH